MRKGLCIMPGVKNQALGINIDVKRIIDLRRQVANEQNPSQITPLEIEQSLATMRLLCRECFIDAHTFGPVEKFEQEAGATTIIKNNTRSYTYFVKHTYFFQND